MGFISPFFYITPFRTTPPRKEGMERIIDLPPSPLGLDRANLTQRPRLSLDHDIGVALDAAGRADPGPVDGPAEGAVGGEAVVGNALLAGLGGILAPEVVVDGVRARDLEVPLPAEGVALQGRGGGEGGEGGGEENGLHFGGS